MKENRIIILILLLIISCKNQEKEKNNQSNENKITLSKLKGSPAFGGARLSIDENNLNSNENGEINFNFNVENYELGAQTANAKEIFIWMIFI